MPEITSGHVTLRYSPECAETAPEILAFAAGCGEYLSRLFEPAEPVRQVIHWFSERDWPGRSYGFCYTSGSDAFMSAADVDLPTELARVADAMDIGRGGPDVERMGRLLGLPGDSTPADVYRRLAREKDFLFRLTAGFVMPHEMTHGYCNRLGYPALPRWFYEGLAQWAAHLMQAQLRPPGEARAVLAWFELLRERGARLVPVSDFARADALGCAGLDTHSYTWYQACLLSMFGEIERLGGAPLLPALVRGARERFAGRREVPAAEMTALFSDCAGRDLGPWFRERYGIG